MAAGNLVPAPVANAIANQNGDVGIGDARPSTPAGQAPPEPVRNRLPTRAVVLIVVLVIIVLIIIANGGSG